MPVKPLPTDVRAGPARKPTGPFVVINPRNIPKGRFYIKDVDKVPCAHKEGCALPSCHEVTIWREGDIYDGKRVEVRLATGSIKPQGKAKGGQ